MRLRRINTTASTVAGLVLAGLTLTAEVARSSCAELNLWAYDEIPEYFYADDAEGLFDALSDWNAACGSRDRVLRIEVLARIWAEAFDQEDLPDYFVAHLVAVQMSSQQSASDDLLDEPVWASFQRFDAFTQDLAADLARSTTPGTIEYLLCRFYSGDHDALWSRLNVPPYAASRLAEMVRDQRELLSRPHVIDVYALSLGVWQGRDGLEGAGTRITLGLQVGLSYGRFSIRAVGEGRIGRFDEEYIVRDGDELYLTREFNGLAFGVEPGIHLFRWGALEGDAVVGLGFEGVEALTADPAIDLPARWVFGFGPSAGANLRWVRGHGFAEIQVRRASSNWSTGSGGSDLDGNSWQWRIGFGMRGEDNEAMRETLGVER